MDPKQKLEDLLASLESAKRFDKGNNRWYYIAGTPEVTKAIRDAEIALREIKRGELKTAL